MNKGLEERLKEISEYAAYPAKDGKDAIVSIAASLALIAARLADAEEHQNIQEVYENVMKFVDVASANRDDERSKHGDSTRAWFLDGRISAFVDVLAFLNKFK